MLALQKSHLKAVTLFITAVKDTKKLISLKTIDFGRTKKNTQKRIRAGILRRSKLEKSA